MNENNNFALVRRPPIAIVKAARRPNQIISRMVVETLAVDASKAFVVRRWHLKAAEEVSQESLLWLGEKCLEHAGNFNDNIEAYKWLWLPAERGSEKALTYFYENGEDYIEEVSFFYERLSPHQIIEASQRVEKFKDMHWNFGDVFGEGGCIMFFANNGLVFLRRVNEVAKPDRTSVVDFLNLPSIETIVATVRVTSSLSDLFFVTRNGEVKKTAVKEFSSACKWGDIAIRIKSGDALVDVKLTIQNIAENNIQRFNDEVILLTKKGMGIRFLQSDVRSMGRPAGGIKGINLEMGDVAIAAVVVIPNAVLLFAFEDGVVKILPLDNFLTQSRGGKGIRVANTLSNIVGALMVKDADEITFITKSKKTIHKRLKEISDGQQIDLMLGDKLVSIK